MGFMSALAIIAGIGLLQMSSIYARTVDLSDSNFEDEVSKQPSFVMFFAPWCGHCKQVKPEWETLSASYANFNNILIGSVDCDVHKAIAAKYEVNGYPTIKFFNGKDEPVNYDGGRSSDDFVEFINKETGLNVKVKKPVDSIRDLDSVSFEANVEKRKKNYLVIFYASWCGHCKTLVPRLPQLMGAFVSDDTIEVVKVDANKHSEIGSKYDVQGYPTLKLFLIDNTVVPYDSAREPLDMLEFINKHIGTHRTLDGGFDTGAWPSDEIKYLVEQFRKADKTEKTEIVEKAKKAVEAATGRFVKYAHFYPKLMKKAAGNPKFLNTEPDRLKKLLENKMGEEPKLNALFRLTILKQLKGEIEPSVQNADDDDKDEL